ncbi:hypothetical protein [Pleomorphovibrio marinus]|uniref:hypothetical protein n=1 Tax=Pleomorphovibrio marinus TaxID=2164132 RepID=UPI001300BD5F|nr:hypothetical protein [Pleomorphovibrio marinus]
MKNCYSLLILFALCYTTACMQSENPEMKCTVIPVNGSDEDIRGKWKLVGFSG